MMLLGNTCPKLVTLSNNERPIKLGLSAAPHRRDIRALLGWKHSSKFTNILLLEAWLRGSK